MKEVVITDSGENPYPSDTFSGKWTVLWPNSRKKYSAIFQEGKEEGLVQCWWENGRLAQEGIKTNGLCVGLWKDYNDEGLMYKETVYHDKPYDFTQRVYDAEGLAIIREFKNGIKIQETILP